jgi:hypothetical protein
MRTDVHENANDGALKCEPPFAQTFSKKTFSKIERETRARDQISGGNKTTIAPDFTLTAEHIAYAKTKGYDQTKAIDMFAAFRNHHLANDTKFANWDAAWRVWVDNERKFKKPDDPHANFL